MTAAPISWPIVTDAIPAYLHFVREPVSMVLSGFMYHQNADEKWLDQKTNVTGNLSSLFHAPPFVELYQTCSAPTSLPLPCICAEFCQYGYPLEFDGVEKLYSYRLFLNTFESAKKRCRATVSKYLKHEWTYREIISNLGKASVLPFLALPLDID